jgi:hypothetical protein
MAEPQEPQDDEQPEDGLANIICPRCDHRYSVPDKWFPEWDTATYTCQTCDFDGPAVMWHQVWKLQHLEANEARNAPALLAQFEGVNYVIPTEFSGAPLRESDWRELRRRIDLFYLGVSARDVAALRALTRSHRKEEQERHDRWLESLQQRKSEPRKQFGWIYLLEGESGHYKIGRTKNLQSRVKALATQAPYQVQQIHAFEVDDAPSAEAALHARFVDKRHIGEWFTLTPEDVEWFKTLTTWPMPESDNGDPA